MCSRPSFTAVERESVAVIQAKENVPTQLMVRVLVKPCACGEGWVARLENNERWSPCWVWEPEAEQIKESL